jgi:hypothetical protein
MVRWGGCQTKPTASVRGGGPAPPSSSDNLQGGGSSPPQACVPTSRGGSRPKEEPRFEVAVGLTNNSKHLWIKAWGVRGVSPPRRKFWRFSVPETLISNYFSRHVKKMVSDFNKAKRQRVRDGVYCNCKCVPHAHAVVIHDRCTVRISCACARGVGLRVRGLSTAF